MSSCIVEAKREYFGSPVCISSPSPSSSLSSSKLSSTLPESPILLGAHNRSQQASPLNEHFHHSPGSPAASRLSCSHQLATSESGSPPQPPPRSAEPERSSVNSDQQTRHDGPQKTPTPPPPVDVAAIYEQPMARKVPQLTGATSRQTSLARLTTFKAPGVADDPLVTRSRRRESGGRNSLESIESRLSIPSATYSDSHRDQVNDHNKRDHQRPHWPSDNSIKVRYVSPPEVPPQLDALPPIGQPLANQHNQGAKDEWRSIPLDDDRQQHLNHHNDDLEHQQPCLKERSSLASIMLARLRGKTTTSAEPRHPAKEYQCELAGQPRSLSPSPLSASDNLRLSVDASTGANGQPAKSAANPASSPSSTADKPADKLASGDGGLAQHDNQHDGSVFRRASKSCSITLPDTILLPLDISSLSWSIVLKFRMHDPLTSLLLWYEGIRAIRFAFCFMGYLVIRRNCKADKLKLTPWK